MQKNQSKYQRLFEAASDGIFIQAQTGIIVDCNESGARLHGLSREEIVGKLPHALFPEIQPDGRVSADVARKMMIAAFGGEPQQFDFKSLRVDGSVFDAEVKLSHIIYNDSDHLLVVIRDITSRIQAESLLRRNQALMQNSMDGIHIMDIEGNIIDVNDSFCEMLGYTREEALGLNIVDWNAEASPEVLRNRLRSFIGKKARFETLHRRKDGALISVEISTGGSEIDGKVYIHAISRDITERKCSEKAIRHESEKNRVLLRGSSDGIHILDYDGNVIEVSDSFCSMLGYAPVELIGMNVSEWDATMSYSKLMKDIREQISTNDRRLFETCHRRKDGTIIDVEINSFPLVLDGRTVLFNSSRDITKRKRDERALAESEAKYRQLFETSTDGIFLLDETGVFVDCNENGAKLIGISKVEIVGMSHADISPERQPDGRLSAEVASERLAATLNDQIQRFECRCLRVDGVSFDAEITMSRIEYQGIPCAQVVARDITERKQTEEALRNSELKLLTILDNVEAYIYLKDTEGRYLYVNRHVRELWNAKMEDIVGNSDEKFFDENTVANIRRNDDRTLIKGEIVREEETNTLPVSGMTHIFHSTKLPLRGEDGKIYALCGISTDITERKQAELKLAESEAQLRTLIEAVPDSIQLKDGEGRWLVANKICLQLFGLERLEWHILSDTEIGIRNPHLADAMAACKKGDEEAWASGKIFRIEEAVTDSLGNDRHFDVIKVPLFDEQHNRKVLIIIARDITEISQATESLRDSKERANNLASLLRLISDNVPDLIWAKDLEKRYIFANKAICEQLLNATGTEEPVGKDDMFFALRERNSHPDDPLWHTFGELCQDSDVVTLNLGKPAQFDEYGNVQGKFLFLDVHKAPFVNDKGEIIGVVGSARDVTEKKLIEEKLKLASLVLENSSEALLVTDENNLIVDINPAFTRLTGYELAEVLGKNPNLMRSGKHSPEFYREMWREIELKGHWQGEIWNRRKNGEIYAEWMTINTIYNEDGSVHRRVALFSDITVKKALEEEIWKQANFDHLTNLPNRRMFRDRLSQDIKKAQRADLKLALMFLDLDNFKEVNDTHGHDKGDALLVETAHRISACVREADTVARLGGDEFTIILPDLNETSCVERIAKGIIESINQPFKLNGDIFYVSASIGITLYPDDATELDGLLKNADQSMYVSKRAGRNCFSYFANPSKKSC